MNTLRTLIVALVATGMAVLPHTAAAGQLNLPAQLAAALGLDDDRDDVQIWTKGGQKRSERGQGRDDDDRDDDDRDDGGRDDDDRDDDDRNEGGRDDDGRDGGRGDRGDDGDDD